MDQRNHERFKVERDHKRLIEELETESIKDEHDRTAQFSDLTRLQKNEGRRKHLKTVKQDEELWRVHKEQIKVDEETLWELSNITEEQREKREIQEDDVWSESEENVVMGSDKNEGGQFRRKDVATEPKH